MTNSITNLQLVIIAGCVFMVAAALFTEVLPLGLETVSENVRINVAVKQYAPGESFNSQEQTRIYDINGSMYVFYETENVTPLQFYSQVSEGREICVNIAQPNRILEQVCMCKCQENGGK